MEKKNRDNILLANLLYLTALIHKSIQERNEKQALPK
jgi:hypothetical protein